MFKTVIPRTTKIAEAPSHGKPIIYHDPYNAGAAAYEVLTQEFIKRLGLNAEPDIAAEKKSPDDSN